MDISQLNWFAVLAAALSSFLLGGLWYSPALFGKAWMKVNAFTEEQVKKFNRGRAFGFSFLLSVIMSLNLAMFLTDTPAECTGACAHKTDIVWGVMAGFLTGIWVFAGLAIVALFENRPTKYILINGFYLLISLTLMGTIIGAWR